MLVDTDVMIWHLRGLLAATKKSLEMRNAQRLPVTTNITERAVALMEFYALSHGLRLADALIAATALENGLKLLTANIKHFVPIDGLLVEKFEPQNPQTLSVHDEGRAT